MEFFFKVITNEPVIVQIRCTDLKFDSNLFTCLIENHVSFIMCWLVIVHDINLLKVILEYRNIYFYIQFNKYLFKIDNYDYKLINYSGQ